MYQFSYLYINIITVTGRLHLTQKKNTSNIYLFHCKNENVQYVCITFGHKLFPIISYKINIMVTINKLIFPEHVGNISLIKTKTSKIYG